MKIKTKLLLGLSSKPLIIILIILFGMLQITSLNKLNTLSETNYDLSLLAEQIQKEVKDEAISLRNLVIFDNQDSFQVELNNIETISERVSHDIAQLDSKTVTKEQKKMVNELKETNIQFNLYKNNVIDLLSKGEKNDAVQLIDDNGHSLHDKLFKEIQTITANFEANMKSSFSVTIKDVQRQVIITSLISLISIIISSGFIIRIVWSFANRLRRVSKEMQIIANGQMDVSTKVEVISHDEIDDVAISFNKMVASLVSQRIREQRLLWNKSNIAEVTTSLSGVESLEALGQTFLSKVIPLLDASHGVLYGKDDSSFTLLASYALTESKQHPVGFTMGEGLLGQAALEKSLIILEDVPPEYIKIKSGLGEESPRYLVILPILFEGDVKGVLEFASFNPMSKEQSAFLEEIVISFGIILESVYGRIKLAHLLEESQVLTEEVQAQSEELQAQQEELIATNEELEEQTQALRQSEEILQQQQEELEHTNVELKEKAAILEEQNKRFELTNREVEKARAELEEKANQLAISSKYKSEFLANMSHELRTPLNSLLILSKLLADNQEGNLNEKQVNFSKTIYSSGSDLLALINDILDLAKIESGKMTVNPSKVFINDLVEFVENSFRPIAIEKDLDFTISIQADLPPYINSDEQRLQQILRNLLSNAFKFTKTGEVILEIGLLAKPNDQSMFVFSIIDTGIGIAKDKQELIFEAFQQADGTTSRRFGGTGLGLSICREISNLLNGEIVVESEQGKGSRFSFYVRDSIEENKMEELQVSMNEVAVSKELTEDSFRKIEEAPEKVELKKKETIEENNDIKRLLIVDDDVRQRNSLMELMGEKNVIIRAVSSGSEALEELKLNNYDFMILDLGLTDINGIDLLGRIKSNIENENLNVFIYTGRDLSVKEEMLLMKYTNTIIIKDQHSLQRLNDELGLYLKTSNEKVEVSHDEGQSDEAVAHEALKGKRILLVDDDVRNVFALMSFLEQYQLDITFAENGRESIEVLEQSPAFDIILMDIMMPEMDGYEAIRRIRDNPEFSTLPIIALTAKAMKEDREKCMEAGASDYIVKPFDPDQLMSLIRVWLYQ